MKFSIITLAAAVTLVSAVEFPGQPACASPCISQAITQGTNCNIEDVACQCNPSNLPGISTAVIPCLLSACTGPGELSQASEAGPSQCSIFAAQGAATASATSTSSAGSSSSETSSASPASTTSSGPASTTGTGAGSQTTASAATSSAGGGGASNGTVTTSPPKSTTAGEVTQNAAQSVGLAGIGAMVGLLAGVVAAL